MAEVKLKLPGGAYSIVVEPGLLARLGGMVREVAGGEKVAVICDAAVAGTWGAAARGSLEAAGYGVVFEVVPSGEPHKTLETVRGLYGAMVGARLERGSPVVAVGGGVVGDTAGFVAATYLRGVPFVQCPTTLLAMVDASVGGKVGVNLPEGKNLIGSFYQPRLVAADTRTLGSLPVRELRCGLAECVKHAVLGDAGLFGWLEERVEGILGLEEAVVVELVRANVAIKAGVVMEDEKETGVRAHLNLGHTFGHAIEAVTGFGGDKGYHHGEAVALGMVAAAGLAVRLGTCEERVVERVVGLLERFGLPTWAGDLPRTGQLMGAMALDKKVKSGRLRLVLPEGLGRVKVVEGVAEGLVAEAWERLRRPYGGK